MKPNDFGRMPQGYFEFSKSWKGIACITCITLYTSLLSVYVCSFLLITMQLFSISNRLANEWKKFSLYFAYYMFQGIQQSKYLEHYHTLVRAILILLGPQVVKRDIEIASTLLKRFVAQFEVNKGHNFNRNHSA